MKSICAKRQHGAALLAMLVVLALGASWYLVSRLNADSGVASATRNVRNAEVLNRAKLALIGYVAQQAAIGDDPGTTTIVEGKNPGSLPCPEAPANYGTSNEGVAAGNCTLPAVGRLPWRTLGLDKLVDAAGEPLWYVVSLGWALSCSTCDTVINSNSVGQLTVDGTANDAVALIVAPGRAFSVPACAGIAAKSQVRPASGPPNLQNYLECENATSPADATFVTTGPSTSFNDQLIRVTVADIMPAIEGGIASRIEREIVPVLKSVYASATWGTSSTNPAFPFPAPFGDPGTSNTYQGQAGLYQGLLPFNYHSGSCAGNARCSTNTITWGTHSVSAIGSPGYLTTPTTSPSSIVPNCYVSGSTPICEGYYYYGGGTTVLTMADPATNITKGLRTFNVTATNHVGTVQTWRWNGTSWVYLGAQAATVSRSLANTGAANFNASLALPSVPNWGYFYVSASRPPSTDFGDHAILDSTAASTGWFVRNEWYRLLYYAIAPNHAPGGTLSCIDSGAITCVQVTNLTDPTKQRAVLALAGRPLSALSQTRPPTTLPLWLDNYLDGAENLNGDSIFIQSPVGRSFNDRFISVNKNP